MKTLNYNKKNNSHFIRFIINISFSLLFVFQTFAQDSLQQPLKIGLVLSGGGAKGLAHIGVLKVLEREGIKPDYIAGTSMGSIVGALYAIGYTASEIEQIVLSLNWEQVLSDEVLREDISIEEKDQDSKYIAEFPIVNWRVSLPRGFRVGQRISNVLAHYTWSVHNVSDFRKFPIPFACVATDIETGEAVTINKGYLPDALRASMAIPSIFSPMEIDGRMLVDGMLVRNFPVSDAKDMGANYIIGVDVGAPLYKKNELSSIFEILDQASSFKSAESTLKQQTQCNILIKPDLVGYNAASFEAADSLIVRGEKAANQHLDAIKQLAANTKKRMIRENVSEKREIDIDTIDIEGLNEVSKYIILGKLDIKKFGKIEIKTIEKGIARIYGSQFFKRVNYKIEERGGKNILVIRVVEQSSNFFKVGINYDSDLKSAILLNLTFRNILGDGSRLLTDLKLSENPAFKIHYSIHTKFKPNIGFSSKFWVQNFDAAYYNADGGLVSKFNFWHYNLSAELHSSMSNQLSLLSGLEGESLSIKPQIAAIDTISYDISFFNAYFRILYDSYDRGVFPRKGSKFYFETKYYINADYEKPNHWNRNFWRFQISYTKIAAVSEHLSFINTWNAGHIQGENVHWGALFFLGGSSSFESNIIAFEGNNFMGADSRCFVSTCVGIQVEPWTDRFFTLKTNIAKLGSTPDEVLVFDDFMYGFGVSFGVKSIIGPLVVNVSQGNRHNELIMNVNIGYRF